MVLVSKAEEVAITCSLTMKSYVANYLVSNRTLSFASREKFNDFFGAGGITESLLEPWFLGPISLL